MPAGALTAGGTSIWRRVKKASPPLSTRPAVAVPRVRPTLRARIWVVTGGLVPGGALAATWPTTCEKTKTPVMVWPEKVSESGLAVVPSCTHTDCAGTVSPSMVASAVRVLSRSFAVPPPRVNGSPAPVVTVTSKASATPAGLRSMVPVAMAKLISPSPKDMVSGADGTPSTLAAAPSWTVSCPAP